MLPELALLEMLLLEEVEFELELRLELDVKLLPLELDMLLELDEALELREILELLELLLEVLETLELTLDIILADDTLDFEDNATCFPVEAGVPEHATSDARTETNNKYLTAFIKGNHTLS